MSEDKYLLLPLLMIATSNCLISALTYVAFSAATEGRRKLWQLWFSGFLAGSGLMALLFWACVTFFD